MDITNILPTEQYDATIVAVAHNEFKTLDIARFSKDKSVVYDVKWMLNGQCDGKL